MDLREAFHKGRAEGEELRREPKPELAAMQATIKNFVNILRTLKTENGQKAFDVVDRDFIKSADSYVIWARDYKSKMVLSIQNEQPFVTMQTEIQDPSSTLLFSEQQVATSAHAALEKICTWIGRAAPDVEPALDETFDDYDFYATAQWVID